MNTERVMEVLRRVEWAQADGAGEFCPCCEWNEEDGHADDCKLAALLSEGKKEQVLADARAEIKAAIGCCCYSRLGFEAWPPIFR